MCGTPVGADVEEINKTSVEEQPKPENPIPNEQSMKTKEEAVPAENDASTTTPPPPITPSDKPAKKSNKTPIIIGVVAAVVVIAVLAVLFFMKGKKDDKTSEESFAVEQQDPNEAELSNLVLDAYKTREIYNLETADFQAARKAASAAEEASGSICIDWDYYYCTQDDYPDRFNVTRMDFINPNKANVYIELIFDREVSHREGNYFTDNVVLVMVRDIGAVWLVDDVWHGGNSIKQEMIECTRNIQGEIMSNTSSNVTKVSYETTFNDLFGKDASTYRFSESDLSPLSAKELTYLRNSVYAKHGYVFKSQELNNYFKKFSWYHPNSSVTDAVLNSIEKANVQYIKNYQEQNNKTYKPNNGNDNKVVVIDGSELRLRLGPSTSSDTFKWPDGTNRHPNVGEQFKYLGESGDFYKIDFNGNELWVSKQFSHIE